MSEELPPNRVELTPWCKEEDLPRSRLVDRDGQPLDVRPSKGFFIFAATNLLFQLAGPRAKGWRKGRIVARPTQINAAYGQQSYLYPYSSMSGYGQAWGFAAGWAWTAIGMGWWQSGQDLSEVVLQGPVRKINSVLVDGVDLGSWQEGGPPNPHYTLYDRRRLVRNIDTTGTLSGAWPWNQALQMPITQPGTWQLDYEWGSDPPADATLAAMALSTELILSIGNPDATALPPRVLHVASQGLDVAVGDPLEYLLKDLTGIPAVDIFLRARNPQRLRRRPVFLAPNSVLQRKPS